jgi:hypothetical protein
MIENNIDLEPYILNEPNMLTYLKYKLNKNSLVKNISEEKIKKPVPNKSSIFIPKENDSLFWCYYIIKNGDTSYELLNIKNVLIAKQMKIDLVKIIRENKQIIKTYKFDTITNIENNLVNENDINIKTIMSLCSIEKINLIYISKKYFFELLMNDDKPIYIIREIEFQSKYNKKYGFEIADSNTLEEIRKTLYKVETLNKPIKALSSYKVQELIDICNKLAIEIVNKETGKNKSKNELYESIIQYF